jgi:hypothetical protein
LGSEAGDCADSVSVHLPPFELTFKIPMEDWPAPAVSSATQIVEPAPETDSVAIALLKRHLEPKPFSGFEMQPK